MPQRSHLRSSRGRWGYVAKLIGMLDMRLGYRTLRPLSEQVSSRPHREEPMPLTDLDDRSRYGWIRGQAIQDAIVRQVAIPPNFALFGGEAFPGKRRRQRGKRLLLAALPGPFMGGAMDTGIDALAPDVRLAIEVVDIGERDPRPQALFDYPHRALDFPFRLRRVRATDPWRDPDGGHEISKERVPARHLALHFQQQHALHAIGQGRLGKPTKVLKGLHQTADQRCRITALDEGHKAHAGVAEDGSEAVELAGRSILLVLKLPPIELHLFSRLGFIAYHRIVSCCWRTQEMDKGFEHAQAPGIAQRQQTRQHGLTIVAMIF